MREPISRRTFLRGLGTAMALPYLDAMLPGLSSAQTAKKVVKATRMAYLFVPNGIHMETWTPEATGANYVLPYTLEPLKNVKGSMNVLTGLAQHNAFALGDGGGDHARSAAAYLTGCHPHKTDGADIKLGVSADQMAAQHMGKATPFASLELGCERGAQAGNCDTGYSCAYSSNISWSSETTPNAHEVDPRQIFERLFGSGDSAQSAESRQLRSKYKKSILDFVLEDASSLKAQLGNRDQSKLDEYFTGVREVEERLARAEKVNLDPHVGQNGIPTGIPADYAEHIRLMYDMMALAFQSDMTRVCTFMLANDGSNRSYRAIGVPEGHHDVSHHGHDPVKQEKIRQINRFHIQQLAYFLEKLNGIQEANGSILDNSMIVFGAGISDGDRHNHDNLPVLLAGKGSGTIKTGQHIRYADNTPMNNLFLTMLDRMGVPTDKLGDSTGRLQQLF